MENVFKFVKLLPKFKEIEAILKNNAEAAYILRLATENITKIQECDRLASPKPSRTEGVDYLVQCLADKYWERIHTGHFSNIPLETRKIYAIANYFKIIYLLLEDCGLWQIEKCSSLLDEAILIGCTEELHPCNEELKSALFDYFNSRLGDTCDVGLELRNIAPMERQRCSCDIPQVDCPPVEIFQSKYFEPKKPVLLLHTIGHWPALSKWRNLKYILKVAGNRTVPIEIGFNYANDEWSQQLVKIRDFMKRQFSASVQEEQTEIEYLAQHDLFEQVPALKADIHIPDYCSLGTQATPVDIKAWLGPSGTISPMHYDPKHNLLCQVFGAKKIILAADTDTPYLYSHETEFLRNTSQIDAAHLDRERFPLTDRVRFYHVTLQEGDCLYIPPKWWHYVKAETDSFSVSFWWE